MDPRRAEPDTSPGTPQAEGTTAPSASPGSASGGAPPSGPSRYAAVHRRRWLVAPALVLVTIVALRAFVVTPFGIPSESMEDTLRVGDRILVSRLTPPEELRRGDVVVFDASAAFHLATPEGGPLRSVLDAVLSLVGEGRPTDYVKRVVGLPGDRVRCCGADGRLEVNGVAVTEPYLAPGEAPSGTTFDVTLPPNRFWVMGDNRGSSADSRAHLGDPGGGTVPGDDIIGKVWVRYWPLDRLGPLD